VDDCGKWGTREQVLPGGEDPIPESAARLSRIGWETE